MLNVLAVLNGDARGQGNNFRQPFNTKRNGCSQCPVCDFADMGFEQEIAWLLLERA